MDGGDPRWKAIGAFRAHRVDHGIGAGDFDVSLLVENVFGESFEIKQEYIHAAVGVLDLAGNPQISLFPNPASEELTVRTTCHGAELEITDLTGNVVKRIKTARATETINVRSLSPGVYFMKITLNEQSGSSMIKIVIQ